MSKSKRPWVDTGRIVPPARPRLQNIPIRTEEGRRISQFFDWWKPVLNVDYAEIEKRILAAENRKQEKE